MFVFLIFIPMIRFPSFQFLDSFLSHCFGFDSNTLSLIFLCSLMGFPASFFYINQQVKQQKLSVRQAKRLIYCLSIPSLSFMLMTITNLFGLRFAVTLWMIQLLSIVILFIQTKSTFITYTFHKNESDSLIHQIHFAFRTMAYILAYLMITLVLKTFFIHYFPFLEIPVRLFFEFSSGCFYLAHLPFHPLFIFLLTSCCLGFGGFCVHFQCFGGCEECHLSYFHYLKYRFLQVLYMCIISIILFYTLVFLNEFW